ncbi:MAG: hypothetical protein C5B47_04715 [Verrucomicrobia bacterium]|nr:MAG: hypothetical protein C5B47_04715 [Verrucomicrobiota bacterium]
MTKLYYPVIRRSPLWLTATAFAFFGLNQSQAVTASALAQKLNLSIEQVTRIQSQNALSPESLNALPPEKLPELLRELGHQDLPRERAAFRLLQEVDEKHQIPPQPILTALKQLQELRRQIKALKVSGIPVGKVIVPKMMILPFTAGLNPNHTGWSNLGPTNIGGRTRSIIVHPTKPGVMWVGSVGGGVWRTDDGGKNFIPVNDLMANLAVSCMAIDPKNPNLIYAGTGEGFGNEDALRGGGIFLTTDGTTWSQLASTMKPEFSVINRLSISSDSKIMLIAVGRTDTSLGGIYRSADAARQTWVRQLSGDICEVAFHPTLSLKAIASGLSDGNAYYSDDAGQHWTSAKHPETWSGRIELAYARKNPDVVYASIDRNGGEIWRSSDGGKNYVKRSAVGSDGNVVRYLGEQGWYDNVVWAADPTNENKIILGGIDLWKSTDGGDSFIDISTWWDERSAHADQHVIASSADFDGVGKKAIYFGNDGGVYETEDIDTVGNDPDPPRVAGWVRLDNTYGVTQFYSGAGNTSSGVIIGGAQDNGTLCSVPSQRLTWTTMFGGDGGYCASDASDPNTFYGEYVFGNIHRSMDQGQTAEFISGQYWDGKQWSWKQIPYQITDAQLQQCNFIAPITIDPNNSNSVLVGCRSLWRTIDAKTPNTNATGPKWTPIKNSTGVNISATAVAKGNSDLIWVGHNNGDVFMTMNGTASAPTWVRINDHGGSVLPSRFCTRVVIDPADSKRVYLAFGGYTSSNVWKTTDSGQTWSNISKGLPQAPVRSLAIHPDNPRFLYLGTEVGVFASEDAGASWSPTNEGPTNCSVEELFWMNRTLVAATHGRGFFQIDLTAAGGASPAVPGG